MTLQLDIKIELQLKIDLLNSKLRQKPIIMKLSLTNGFQLQIEPKLS